MFKPDKPICPLMRGPCVEAKCRFWVHLLGTDPQSGQPLDKFDCAISFLPVLLIEGAQQTRQAGAAVESMRNEMALGLAKMTAGTTRLNQLIDEARQLAGARSREREIAHEH